MSGLNEARKLRLEIIKTKLPLLIYWPHILDDDLGKLEELLTPNK